ncbi:MAG: bifunctional glutamate N-acetyltransferase/amino-acid acetyltransferase ArgJ [Planctomycetes bacterium]|nr:bifunctional glutamate N-acetyltransferase/amino-acid acetyltransferase ArgJ [Planctomycetota bacterium]
MSNLSILSPKGFRAAGVACGLKSVAGKRDVGLLVADQATGAAAVFTTNLVAAAPVLVSRETVKRGRPRAVVVNSGNANCCTGDQGMADAREMVRLAAEAIGAEGDEVLVCSTGKIGSAMPMDKVTAGIRAAAKALKGGDRAAEDFAEAIMTTDLVSKTCGLREKIGATEVAIGGACKGSGMIAPNMATMLAFVTTDANIGSRALAAALRTAVAGSFNLVSVDSDTSTNDTVIALASGAAGGREIEQGSDEYVAFSAMLRSVCLDLALQIAADGEGATRVIEVRVEGAATEQDARAAARAIVDSPLVKCAVHGGDPNWGRVVAAAGRSGAKIDVSRMKHWIGEELVFDAGTPTAFDVAACERHMKEPRVLLRVDLGVGTEDYTCYGCDLSRDYVTINADYHT